MFARQLDVVQHEKCDAVIAHLGQLHYDVSLHWMLDRRHLAAAADALAAWTQNVREAAMHDAFSEGQILKRREAAHKQASFARSHFLTATCV